MSLWLFTAQVPASRAARLLSYEHFEDVVSLVQSAQVVDFVWEPYTGPELRGTNRATFLLALSARRYDAFFNSPVGLRAQYAMAPAQGETANRRILDALHRRLIRSARIREPSLQTKVVWSLCAPQAKIWIYEPEVSRQLGATRPAIDYPRWASASEDGAGLLAPCGRQLQVMGGWIRSDGLAASSPKKERRSVEIHETGFS